MRMNIMRFNHIILIVVLIFPSITFSQFQLAEGDFNSENMHARTTLLDDENGILVISTEITLGSCSGSVTGIGKILDRKFAFTPYVKAEDNLNCKFIGEFSQNWDKLTITESEGCTFYHGASCGWEGYTAVKLTSPPIDQTIKSSCQLPNSSHTKINEPF
jgi:hypothetical protein